MTLLFFFDANAIRHHATLNQTENVPLIFPAFTACLSVSVAIMYKTVRGHAFLILGFRRAVDKAKLFLGNMLHVACCMFGDDAIYRSRITRKGLYCRFG